MVYLSLTETPTFPHSATARTLPAHLCSTIPLLHLLQDVFPTALSLNGSLAKKREGERTVVSLLILWKE